MEVDLFEVTLKHSDVTEAVDVQRNCIANRVLLADINFGKRRLAFFKSSSGKISTQLPLAS
jgi:hypothetical protein